MLQAFIYGTSVSCLSILINLLTMPFRFAGLVTPFSLRSHHRLNLDESRLDRDEFSVPASHLKKFSPFEPSMNPDYGFRDEGAPAALG